MSDIAERITRDIASALADDNLPLPMLPEVALRVRAAADHPDTDVDALAAVLAEDPGLSARVIRVANSPLVRAPVPVSELRGAVARMGLAFTANLATGYAMQQMFQSTNELVDETLRSTWRHAQDVAAVACVLCRHFTLLRPDLALLGGLTHSIGVLPVLAWVEEQSDLALDAAGLQAALDAVHGELGGMIMKEWGFPQALCIIPPQYLWLDRKSADTDYVDVVTVANLHTHAGSDHPLADVDWSRVPAFQRLGLEQHIEHTEGQTPADLGEDLDNDINATREALA